MKETKDCMATFYAINKDLDISIGCFYTKEEMSTAKLDMQPKIFMGNEVFKTGCGLAEEPRLDYGKITLIKKGSSPQLRTSIMTIQGDSGGPVFHEYKVIGLIAFIKVNRHGILHSISFALPLERFKTWSEDSGNNLSFVWDHTKPIPKLPFYYLDFKE